MARLLETLSKGAVRSANSSFECEGSSTDNSLPLVFASVRSMCDVVDMVQYGWIDKDKQPGL